MKSSAISSQPCFSLIILLVCSFLLYLPTFNGTWLMDDYSVIVYNPDIRSLSNFFANSLPGRPLRELSYLLDYTLFGLDPWGFHFQNIFWHCLNCWLVYLLAVRINLGATVAWLSSMLFLVHPVHVEVVANSSHRKDSLALAFILMALLCCVNSYDQKSSSRRATYLAGALILWITAFYAKGNSIVFPLLVIAYEYSLVSDEKRIFVRWKKMVPLLGILSVITLIGWYFYISTLPSFNAAVMGAFIKTENLTNFSMYSYILMVLKSFAFMFSKLIIPLNLTMEYIYAAPTSILDVWVISALVLLVITAATACWWNKKSPELFFLLSFVAILWFPTANVLWHFSYFAADRYMYAPSAGFCILAVLATERISRCYSRYFIVCWACIISVFSVLTWNQTAVWHNEMSLHTQMLKVSPRSLEAMVGLSNAYYSAKEYNSSAMYAKQAMERDVTDFRPYLNLGNIYYAHGKLNEALELLTESKKRNPLSSVVHNALGTVYDDLGDSGQAIECFKMALKLRPDYFEAYTNIGVAYERAGNLSDAELALNQALTINGKHVPAWYNLGIVRYKNKNMLGARVAFSEAVKLDPGNIDALNNLSVVCKETGDEACYLDAIRRVESVRGKGVSE